MSGESRSFWSHVETWMGHPVFWELGDIHIKAGKMSQSRWLVPSREWHSAEAEGIDGHQAVLQMPHLPGWQRVSVVAHVRRSSGASSWMPGSLRGLFSPSGGSIGGWWMMAVVGHRVWHSKQEAVLCCLFVLNQRGLRERDQIVLGLPLLPHLSLTSCT